MRIGPKGPQGGPILATRSPFAQAREGPVKRQKRAISGSGRPLSAGSIPARSGSPIPSQTPDAFERATHDLEFGHFAGLVEFDAVDALQRPFADIAPNSGAGVVGSGVLASAVAPAFIPPYGALVGLLFRQCRFEAWSEQIRDDG
jgi:hypothetical protein